MKCLRYFGVAHWTVNEPNEQTIQNGMLIESNPYNLKTDAKKCDWPKNLLL